MSSCGPIDCTGDGTPVEPTTSSLRKRSATDGSVPDATIALAVTDCDWRPDAGPNRGSGYTGALPIECEGTPRTHPPKKDGDSKNGLLGSNVVVCAPRPFAQDVKEIIARRSTVLSGSVAVVHDAAKKSDFMAELRSLDKSLIFEPMRVVRAAAQTPRKCGAYQWSLCNIRLPATTKTPSNVKVAVLDTGVGLHETMNTATVTRKAITGYHEVDEGNHGTAVAAIIGGQSSTNGWRGVAPGVQLLSVSMMNAAGVGKSSHAAAALEVAIDWKADIINASWTADGDDRCVRMLVERAGKEGRLIIVAAGNDSTNLDDPRSAFPPATYDYDNIIVVAAIDDHNSKTRRSNYGARRVDLFAPGYSAVVPENCPESDPLCTVAGTHTRDRYRLMGGSSLAAAHVTGLAALLWADLGNAGEVRNRILGCTSGVEKRSASQVCSSGRADVARALSDKDCGDLPLRCQ